MGDGPWPPVLCIKICLLSMAWREPIGPSGLVVMAPYQQKKMKTVKFRNLQGTNMVHINFCTNLPVAFSFGGRYVLPLCVYPSTEFASDNDGLPLVWCQTLSLFNACYLLIESVEIHKNTKANSFKKTLWNLTYSVRNPDRARNFQEYFDGFMQEKRNSSPVRYHWNYVSFRFYHRFSVSFVQVHVTPGLTLTKWITRVHYVDRTLTRTSHFSMTASPALLEPSLTW